MGLLTVLLLSRWVFLAATPSWIQLFVEGNRAFFWVQGAEEDEWRFETSSDMKNWSNAPGLGAAFSGQAFFASIPRDIQGEGTRFYRAVRTSGLYDAAILRTIHLILIWADEDGQASTGLHANFKLAASGEQVLLIDSDEEDNAVLDSVVFGAQQTDRSYGRTAANPVLWKVQTPTPGRANP